MAIIKENQNEYDGELSKDFQETECNVSSERVKIGLNGHALKKKIPMNMDANGI